VSGLRPKAARMTTPEERAPLYAAYAAARAEAEHLGAEIWDDRITQAAYSAAEPLIAALTLRQAADDPAIGAWSGAAEWLRRRAMQIEADATAEALARHARRDRERTTVTPADGQTEEATR
jgi:hypothetical protein